MPYRASMPIDHRWSIVTIRWHSRRERHLDIRDLCSDRQANRRGTVRTRTLIERDALGGAVSERVHVSVPGLGGSHLDERARHERHHRQQEEGNECNRRTWLSLDHDV